ncbi:MAG TPA: serine/threonine-protein kinase [Planctomycetaceae bacterium]|nr:serine/threonine-protein kinase [Planctomycetaceae bacterium]
MANSQSKDGGDLGKHRPQVQSSDPAAKTTAAAAGSNRGDTAAPSGSNGRTELPSQFGRYRVKKRLGGGGMGTVYLVENTELEREEALKVPHFAEGDDAQLRERFLREARSAAKLDHLNLCPVYDVGVQDGIYYLTMRFLKGKLLSDYTGKAQPARKAVEIVTKLTQALEAAHAKGVIHRDLKPSNVMMVAGVGPVVMDFGLSKQFRLTDQKLTQEGSMLGTPAYMPPEQVNGNLEQMGPASDVYSLGVVLYQLLTGRLPFEGTMAAIFGQILYAEAPLPSALVAGLNPELDGICRKAMAKASTERYPSMKAFAAALMNYLRSTAPTDGAGNLVPTVVGKADIFQAATVAQPRSSLPPTQTGANVPSTIRKPDRSRQTHLGARRADDDEGEERRGSSFGTILVRGMILMLVLATMVGGGWLTYVVMQKTDQKSDPVAEATPPASSKEADAKQPLAEATLPTSSKEADSKQPVAEVTPPTSEKEADSKQVAVKPAEPSPDNQEDEKDEIKYDMDYLEKGFGMKLNAVKLQPVNTKGDMQITLTLEFTKNLDDRAFIGPSNKEIVQNAFAGKPWEDLFGRGNRGSARVVLRCYFFDVDGVVFIKQLPGKIQGEVSGKKGDSFRITQTMPNAVLEKTKRISFRKEEQE